LLGFFGPDSRGQEANVVCGPTSLADCLADTSYAGAIIGRYANRIAHAAITLDGEHYRLTANDGSNTLHGGASGFDRACWQIVMVEVQADCAFVELAHESEDGDEGFPGNLEVRARYTLFAGGKLQLDLTATTDRLTVVSLTCHPYFNLRGVDSPEPGACLQHELQIPATHFLPVSVHFIPESVSREVAGTPFDFREPYPIGERVDHEHSQLRRARGYDHYFHVDSAWPQPPSPVPHAVLREPSFGRQLKIHSTLPGLQLYTGNFLSERKDGVVDDPSRARPLPFRSALCLEPQFPPDAPNRPNFPSPRLAPGTPWRHTIVYELGVEP